jgi:cation diffusion facilitator CzcD-associated flavoprotein CzcO
MTFNHRVVQATWREADAKWVVSIARTSESGEPEIIVDECDVLISGTGILNQWKYPNIEGLKDYKGKLLHTANWDESWDWDGKTVAVLGSGASAIQVVPELQKSEFSVYALYHRVQCLCFSQRPKPLMSTSVVQHG